MKLPNLVFVFVFVPFLVQAGVIMRECDVCNGRFAREEGVVSVELADLPSDVVRVSERTPTGSCPVESVVDASCERPLVVCRLRGTTPAYGVRTLVFSTGEAQKPDLTDLVWQEKNDRIVVGTRWFEVSHPKHGGGGFPQGVVFRCSGFVDRELALLDRAYRKDNGCYSVCDDAAASARIVFASPLRVVVEAHVAFCQGSRPAPDGLSGVYRYVYSAGSPVIEVSRKVMRNGALPAVDWDELHFLQLSRKTRYYDAFFTGPVNRIRTLDPKGGKGGSCGGRQWGLMSSGREAAGVGGGWTDCWDAAREYVYNVQRNVLTFPATKDTCCQRGLLYFGPSDASEAWLENMLGEDREMRVIPRGRQSGPRSGPVASSRDDAIVLRGNGVKLTFGPSAEGFPVLGLDSQRGHRFFGAGSCRGLWRMTFSEGVGGTRHRLEANDIEGATCSRKADGLCFTWRDMSIGDEKGVLDVACDVLWNADERQYEFRLSVRNRSKTQGLVSVEYPLLREPLKKGMGTACLPGGNWGLRRVTDPTFSVDAVYPSVASPMQFLAFEQDDETAYLAAHDPASCEKVFHATPFDDVSIETVAADCGVAGRGTGLVFPVVLAVERGSWWQAAKRYRRWAVDKALWMRKGTIANRKDYPQRLTDNALWFRFGGTPREVEANVTKAETLIAGRVPFALHWYCWHQIPFDNSYPEYFPAKDGFAESVKRMTSRGILVMPYVNARLWDSEIASFSAEAVGACSKDPSGHWCIEDYGSGRKLCAMCPSTPVWQRKMRAVGERLLDECDVNALYLDQVASARPAGCFDAGHGHPLGGGSHWTDGYRALLAPIHGLAVAKGAALAVENTAEPYLDNADAFLTWSPNREDDIPALPAVYSGYTTYFGCLESAKDDLAAFRALHVRNFLWGCQLGWNEMWMLDESHRQHFELAVRLAECRQSANEFFALGELVGDLKSEGVNPPFTVTWWGDDGAHDVTMPSVQATLWKAASGERLLAVANLSPVRRLFEKRLENGSGLAFPLEPGEVRLERLGHKILADGRKEKR